MRYKGEPTLGLLHHPMLKRKNGYKMVRDLMR